MGVRAFTWRARRLGVQLVSSIWISLVSVHVLLMPLGGCGGGGNPATDLVAAGVEYSGALGAGGREPPTAIELEAALGAELERLGIDPAKELSAAPSAGNAVFDLCARIVEAGELEEGSPPGVLLTWTERLIGDYNQDGEVGVSDLTPLGQRYDEAIVYDDPELHDGLAYWPAGDAEDDGEVAAGEPPTPGSGADNWRKARIDGNADGLIYLTDITSIAQHWQQRLSGYRVYRWHDITGETDLVADPASPEWPLTVARAATFPDGADSAHPHRPVRYQYLDPVELGGTYRYHLAPYSLADEAEGPASEPVEARRNLAPQAVLTVSHYQPGSAVCELSAEHSFDIDGQIVRYEWDLNGDGEFELDGGTEPKVEHVFAGLGNHWPAVRVTDNEGATHAVQEPVQVGSPIAAFFTATPNEGQPPLTVSFDPAPSFALSGLTRYEWDLDGDGEVDETREAPEILEHTYKFAGYYQPALEVWDADDLQAAYSRTITVEPPPGLAVTLMPKSTEGLPQFVLYTATAWHAVEPVSYAWDLDGDGKFEHETGQSNEYNVQLASPGPNTIAVRATDAIGAIAYDAADNRVHAVPFVLLSLPGDLSHPGEAVLDASASHDDDDGIVGFHWEISGSEEWSTDTTESVLTHYFDVGNYHITVEATDHYGYTGEDSDSLAVGLLVDLVSDVSLSADRTAGPPGSEVTFHLEGELRHEDLVLESLWLDAGDGTFYDLGEVLTADKSHTYTEGSFQAEAELRFTYKGAGYSKRDWLQIYLSDEQVALIRDDGGVYDANYDALASDLNSLWGFTSFDWYSGIPADLDPAAWDVVVWYRGGPGDDIEPQVYTTAWTDPEIDDYIQLMKDGHRVLLMSQSHGRNPGVDIDLSEIGDGWEDWYGAEHGWQPLGGSIDDDDIRHPWAASLGPGKATGSTGLYGFLGAAPRNILATTEFGGKGISSGYGYDRPIVAERYNGAGSCGDIPITYSFGPGRQFTGVGFYDAFMQFHPYANAGPYFVAGVNLDPPFEGLYDLAFVSYGNTAADRKSVV